MIRVGNFRQKINSAEDGIDGTNGYFRRNSGCSAEQKTLGIPFRTVPRKRRRLRIPFRWTKIEKTFGIPFRTFSGREKNSEFPSGSFSRRENNSEFRSEPFSGRENYSEQNAAAQNFKKSGRKRTFELRTNHFDKLFCLFCKTNFLQNVDAVRVIIEAVRVP